LLASDKDADFHGSFFTAQFCAVEASNFVEREGIFTVRNGTMP
jgi:hypothetical protein